MANIQKCQARTRVGAMKVRGIKGIKKPRTIGEVFSLDLDIPDVRAAYHHLLANGAIKPIGEAVKTEAKTTEREAVPEISETELPSAPVVDDLENPLSEETTVFVISEPDEPEIIESEPVPEVEAIGPDTTLVYIYEFHREEIEFLTVEQIDSLRRIGVATVADIDIRTDQDMMSLQGIGRGKVRSLRDIYDRYGAGDG